MAVALRPISIPDFSAPGEQPRIPAATYAARCEALTARAACDWVAVYADREHFANIAFLTGFEPRFEEALLLLGAGRRVLVVGNECESYTPIAGLEGCETVLCQSFSLMGQDRSRRASLVDVLRAVGIRAGDSVGLAGWKYLEPEEWDGEAPSFFAPAFVVDSLRRVAGAGGEVSDVTALLLHPTTGLRSTIDADQIAAFEWAAARGSAALWRIVAGARPGDSEFAAAARMGYAGEPMSCHTILASGGPGETIMGLRSPSARILERGDGVTVGIGLWGGLSCRAGLLAEADEAFLKTAADYFAGLVTWYETSGIGAEGGAIHAAVAESLARGGLRSSLNPGHLTGLDEWTHSPVRPGSTERIASGMPFQVDIIPAPMPAGWTLNCEDGVVFADAALQAELKARHPATLARMLARRDFVRNELGVPVKDDLLPLSAIPLCLPPFWLRPDLLLTLG
ncbi:Xaa-Pro aminopeptidase [Labrys wisconsinensis]|uniref:Xaa-Pro aminopeptidase n=1 Tax=Labrys wisconsinensis TaxID=425677 RepID=A0ABU0JEE3_9HYPH|nr:Xaa-Pro aminopeptidase [Labrys wisconsinensis]MDQ0471990.1 hypothetical protein [Labrys wisconsinensis]